MEQKGDRPELITNEEWRGGGVLCDFGKNKKKMKRGMEEKE